MDLCDKKQSNQGLTREERDVLAKKEGSRRAIVQMGRLDRGVKIPSPSPIPLGPGYISFSPSLLLHPGQAGAVRTIFSIMAYYSEHQGYGFRYEDESNNYAPQQFYSPPTHIPRHQEMFPMELNGPPFGQPTIPAPVVQSHVQVHTQDDFDDIDNLTLLSLEFTWSAEDDPIRPVILEEMKKIKSGKELVEEVRKIEKNINVGCTISSLLDLSVSGISLEVCEVPTPSHPAEQDSKSTEEEIPRIEDELEYKEQDDQELEYPSEQVQDPMSISPEEVKEADVDEDEEPEIHLPIVIQERDVSGFCLCTYQYMLTRFEVTSLGIPVESEHGDEGKQWGTHMEERSWSVHEEEKGEESQCKRM
ncbi:hypothetical protein TRIUR3_25903 [Triticum urartu]|uniref:Uncharacterized protein n=1 Tax=Triticum urartu TaxID=4572 RepID=M7Z9J5_TRIUA|nr:hypothetical protein TRIUR3_25903 [Triticum urartu]